MQRSSSAKLNYHFNQKKEKKLILLPARIVMSTQDESGIPFVLSSDQQSFRLLELPPSLIELLTSREPPKYCLIPNVVDYADYSESLSLKSDANSQAVLCTENATFQIRQVHSSNSIFILQSSETQREEHYVPTTSLSAIAQCNASLELTPIPSSTMEYQATKFLREHLPVYKGFVTDLGSETGGEFRDRKSKADMMDDSPFSSGEFDMAWHGMCAFEVGGQAWLPTSSALVSVWRSIVLAAIEGVINLEQRFHITALEKTMDDTGHPWPLSRAVAINLSTHIDRTKDGCESLAPCPNLSDALGRPNPKQRQDSTVGWSCVSAVVH